jgi:hypothetical protein
MTLKIDRRTFLQALIAAGASFALPVKPTKAQIDKVWVEAQANPWFFEVDENGTLVEEGILEPDTWADVFNDISTASFKDPQIIIREIEGCYPLISFLNFKINDEIESLEKDLETDPPKTKTELDLVQKKIASLKNLSDEYDEPWKDWIELEGTEGVEKFKQLVDGWLSDPVDWMQSEWFPRNFGGQGKALTFFDQQPFKLLDELGVVIIDGEHPGSSYYAAELRNDIADANAAVERLGLPFRFKKENDNPLPAVKLAKMPPAPSKLAIAIHGPGDLEELQRIDVAITASGVLTGPNALPPEAVAAFEEFESAMTKISGTVAGLARLRTLSTLRSRVNAFFVVKGRAPTVPELQRLWDAT